jgi:hypothetical protein
MMEPPAPISSEDAIKLERRSRAILWAQNVLKAHPRIKGNDLIHLQAVLVEAVMQEIPLKALVVAINDNGGHYKVTLKGYRNIMYDHIWSSAFHGPTRSAHLRCVGKTYTQLVSTGIIKILQVYKKRNLSDDDEDDVLVTTPQQEDVPASIGRFDQRAKAVAWAQIVLADHKEVKQQDRPYVEAALVEAAMQESPLPKMLVVGINTKDDDDHYKITLHGFHNPIDDVLWTNAFIGKHRHAMMDNVSQTYNQETDQGAIKVIEVRKVKLAGQREESSKRDK